MNTMQQEFDAVVDHLFKQGRPAKDYEGTCKYRGDEGTMCAVGCRIPDSVYDPKMECKSVSLLLTEFSDVLPPEIGEYVSVFSSLQKMHDNWPSRPVGFDNEYLNIELAFIAARFGLEFAAREL